MWSAKFAIQTTISYIPQFHTYIHTKITITKHHNPQFQNHHYKNHQASSSTVFFPLEPSGSIAITMKNQSSFSLLRELLSSPSTLSILFNNPGIIILNRTHIWGSNKSKYPHPCRWTWHPNNKEQRNYSPNSTILSILNPNTQITNKFWKLPCGCMSRIFSLDYLWSKRFPIEQTHHKSTIAFHSFWISHNFTNNAW